MLIFEQNTKFPPEIRPESIERQKIDLKNKIMRREWEKLVAEQDYPNQPFSLEEFSIDFEPSSDLFVQQEEFDGGDCWRGINR